MKEITIGGISEDTVKFGKKVTFLAGGAKYSFFDTKKDGGYTKAYEQFKKYNYSVGDIVMAEVKSEEKTFVNNEGNTINYTQRTIIYFEEVDHVPSVRKAESPDDIWAYAKGLEERITDLEGERTTAKSDEPPQFDEG